MSFLLDLTTMIATSLSMTLNTNIFCGVLPITNPTTYILVREIAGGSESFSGMISQPIQVLCQDKSFFDADVLATSVHSLLARKPGFSNITLSEVYYCDVLERPHLISRGPNAEFVFTAQYLVRMH